MCNIATILSLYEVMTSLNQKSCLTTYKYNNLTDIGRRYQSNRINLPTGMPSISACSSNRRVLTVLPPSTLREARGSSES